MDRVLSSYVKKFYVPAVKSEAHITADDYKVAKAASQEEAELARVWEAIRVFDCTTDIDKKEHIVEGQELEVRCAIALGQAKSETVMVELFYMYQDGHAFDILTMKLDKQQDGKAYYKTSFKIKGYGMQSFNVRVRPANEIVADCNPEMIKWKD